MLPPKNDLRKIKREVLSELKSVIESIDMEDISRFNAGYKRYGFQEFVLEQTWYWDAVIESYFKLGSNCQRVFDIGTFIPYYPVILKRLGIVVTCGEKFNLYGPTYNTITDYLSKKGIDIVDIDTLDSNELQDYDVFLIAVLEHLCGSPKQLLIKASDILGATGKLYIVVPNISRLYNIVNLVRGKSVLPNYLNYFNSDYPFEGHHRPMTREELGIMFREGGFKIIKSKHLSNRPLSEGAQNIIYNIIGSLIPRYADSYLIVGENNVKLH